MLGYLGFQNACASETNIPSQSQWVSMKKQVLLPNGEHIAYLEAGNPEGPPLLLIHGYTDNSRSWSLLTPYLARYHLVMVDLPGHGDSSKPTTGLDLASLASDMNDFMDVIKLKSANVAGHSLGSMTAATMAALYPSRVDKLILISSGTRIPSASLDWLWENLSAKQFPLSPDSSFMNEWYANPTPVNSDFLSHERQESAHLPESTWMGVLRALSVTDWSYAAHSIKAPTLILWGDKDAIFDAASQQHLKQLLPNAQYQTYHGHGHNMLWEVPKEVGHRMDAFLGGTSLH